MLKIAIVTSCFHPVINGVVRMVDHYRKGLTQLGHEVTIFTFGPPHSTDDGNVVRMAGIPLGKSGYYVRHNFPKTILELLNKMDIIHCHHLFLGAEKLAGKITPPIVYTNHTRYDIYMAHYLPIPGKKVRHTVAHLLIGRLWPRNTAGCHTIIAPSNSIKQIMESFGVSVPIQVIYNGIELSRFNFRPARALSQKEITGVYVGRISAEKNIVPLVSALILLCQRVSHLRFRLIGNGPLYSKCQMLVRQADCSKQIELLGWKSAEDIPGLLANADFQMTMSVSEVHPLAILEGMAAGLPSVVLNEPAMAECVGNSGIIANSTAEWIDGVCALAQSSERRGKLALLALKRAKAYGINQTIVQTVQLYRSAIDQTIVKQK